MKKIIVGLLALLVAPFSFAQLAGNDLKQINDIIRTTPGVTTVATGSGVTATAAGEAAVAGLRIPVSVAASVPKSAIAGAAVRALGGPVGAAVTVGSVVLPLLPRYHTCPAGSQFPSAFYCRDGDPQPDTTKNTGTMLWKTGSTIYFPTQYQACAAHTSNNFTHIAPWNGFPYACWRGSNVIAVLEQSGTCAAPNVMLTDVTQTAYVGGCYAPGPSVVEAATKEQMQQDLQTKLDEDFNRNKALYDAIKKDQADALARGAQWPADAEPVTATVPVTVIAPPVTGPETVTGTRTVPNADGTTSTETTKQKTTVTPTQQGTTVGDTKIVYKTDVTTTVTTVNNTTNVSNTTTSTSSAPSVSEDKPADPCEKNPDRAGCAKLGEVPKAETIPSLDVPMTYTPTVFASNANCPAPITYDLGRLGGMRTFSWQPMCDQMVIIRAVMLAIGAAAAAFILFAGVKDL